MSDDVSETATPLGVENLIVPALAGVMAFVVGLIVYQTVVVSATGIVRTVGVVAALLVVPVAVAAWAKRIL